MNTDVGDLVDWNVTQKIKIKKRENIKKKLLVVFIASIIGRLLV